MLNESVIDRTTDRVAEREVQSMWRLRSPYAAMREFNRLIDNEFREPVDTENQQMAALRRMLRHATRNVPYYRDMFLDNGLRAADFRSPNRLQELPVMDKGSVRKHHDALRATALPQGERLYGSLASSGTTGRPVSVPQTWRNNLIFSILNQRHYRWYRLDPQRTLAFFRIAAQLPGTAEGQALKDGDTLHLPAWRYVGRFFETGPWLGFNITNPVDAQLAWLDRQRPDYLATYAESLEHLCFAGPEILPRLGLGATIALSEQLTPSMRRRIESGFRAPVHQGYGLAEIGMVAIECPYGRFHVHTEHCIVEIVDAEGIPCRPGETGRVVVTTLNNLAMPLIRYDTDDLATAVSGACPCGRTLPGFGQLQGRYSRIAFLPEGTLTRVAAIRHCIDTLPDALMQNFRRFQLHQFRSGDFELRLVTEGPLDDGFMTAIHAVWDSLSPGQACALQIRYVDAIARTPGGKNLDFTSEYFPAPDLT